VKLDLEGASVAVAEVARRTPLLEAHALSARVGVPVWVKAEGLQVTGSFKSRLAALTEDERSKGVVTCSSGNHGKAVAYVADRMRVPATICVPTWVDPVKLAGIQGFGVEAKRIGKTFDESEAHALELADRTGRTYVSAYDDPWVIAGQGTLALEILDQLPERPTAVLVPLSGGGLAGGMAYALSERLGRDAPPVIGVSAANAAVMMESVRAGRPVELPEQDTLANALAGGIGLDNEHSFRLVSEFVRDHVSVTEAQIAEAMAHCASRLSLVVEGGGSVALAALLSGAWSPANDGEPSGPVVAVLSGGNVAASTLASVLLSASA
jgi:threonine dehydratase